MKINDNGRLTKNPDRQITTNGKHLTKFTIAIQRDFKEDGEYKSDFFNLVSFGKTAEYINNYIHKGDLVHIDGKVQNNNYEKDGIKVYNDEYKCNSIKLLHRKEKLSESVKVDIDDDFNESQLPF